ncbi:unnamed protein product [Brassica oleracea var. botrytis]
MTIFQIIYSFGHTFCLRNVKLLSGVLEGFHDSSEFYSLPYLISYISSLVKKLGSGGRCWVSLLIDGLDVRGDSHSVKEKRYK